MTAPARPAGWLFDRLDDDAIAVYTPSGTSVVVKSTPQGLREFPEVVLHELVTGILKAEAKPAPAPQPAPITDDRIDAHLDAILRATGSALRHYTMQKSRDDMRAALRRAVEGKQP